MVKDNYGVCEEMAPMVITRWHLWWVLGSGLSGKPVMVEGRQCLRCGMCGRRGEKGGTSGRSREASGQHIQHHPHTLQ